MDLFGESRGGPVAAFGASVGRESLRLFFDLLKIMVPTMVAVRIAVEMGAIEAASRVFAPVMSVVGLPPEMGVVWATGMLVGTYAAVAAFFEFHATVDLTVAQASIVGALLLIAHSLPVEQAVVRKAGPGLLATTVLRVGGAFVYGWVLHVVYDAGPFLQAPLRLAWLPEASARAGWLEWAWSSALSLGTFFLIIVALIVAMRGLDAVGFNRWLTRRLAPALWVMRIDADAAPLTMIGVLLGLTFGSGLIIREARDGVMAPRTIFLALVLMGFCHSLVEDTLLFLAIGADVSATLIGRAAFSLLAMMVIGPVIHALPDRVFFGVLYAKPAGESLAGAGASR